MKELSYRLISLLGLVMTLSCADLWVQLPFFLFGAPDLFFRKRINGSTAVKNTSILSLCSERNWPQSVDLGRQAKGVGATPGMDLVSYQREIQENGMDIERLGEGTLDRFRRCGRSNQETEQDKNCYPEPLLSKQGLKESVVVDKLADDGKDEEQDIEKPGHQCFPGLVLIKNQVTQIIKVIKKKAAAKCVSAAA